MAIVKRNIQVEVVNGPSLDMLLDSLKYALNRDAKLRPRFTSKYGKIYSVIIDGICRVKDNDAQVTLQGTLDFDGEETFNYSFTGLYDTKKRTGTIDFTHSFVTESTTVSEAEFIRIDELAKKFDRNLLQVHN